MPILQCTQWAFSTQTNKIQIIANPRCVACASNWKSNKNDDFSTLHFCCCFVDMIYLLYCSSHHVRCSVRIHFVTVSTTIGTFFLFKTSKLEMVFTIYGIFVDIFLCNRVSMCRVMLSAHCLDMCVYLF